MERDRRQTGTPRATHDVSVIFFEFYACMQGLARDFVICTYVYHTPRILADAPASGQKRHDIRSKREGNDVTEWIGPETLQLAHIVVSPVSRLCGPEGFTPHLPFKASSRIFPGS